MTSIEETLHLAAQTEDQQTRLVLLDDAVDAMGKQIYGPLSSQIIVELVGCLTSLKFKLADMYRNKNG